MEKETKLPYTKVMIDSKVLRKSVENIIILPEDYSTGREYPVLYLLLGAGNPLDSWVTLTSICEYAMKFDMIIATPCNGWQNRQSWYVDSPVLEHSAYETYVTGEFIEYMDSNYSTIKGKYGRAISGISMGGHGAFTLAAKHTDLYCSMSSFMGCMDLETWRGQGSWLYDSIAGALGEYKTNSALWKSNSAINLVHKFQGTDLKLKIICGNEDLVENGWGSYPDNERLHQELDRVGVRHEYTIFSGGHSYEEIDRFLPEVLLFHYNSFKTKEIFQNGPV
jgi:S-formylglutathione hydrolase FrmB